MAMKGEEVVVMKGVDEVVVVAMKGEEVVATKGVEVVATKDVAVDEAVEGAVMTVEVGVMDEGSVVGVEGGEDRSIWASWTPLKEFYPRQE